MLYQRTVTYAIKALSNQIHRNIVRHAQGGKSPCGELNALTGMQYGVIAFLGERMEVDTFQRDIEQAFNIRRSTATGILQIMEKNGLLYRQSVAQDARLKKLILSDAALQIRREILERIEVCEKRLTAGISQKELDIFFRVIDKICKNIR